MKILFFIPSMYGGGAEKVLKYLVENVNAKDRILCTLESGKNYEIKRDIKYVKLTKLDGRDNFMKKVIYFLIQYIKFYFLIKREKPDIIISFLERSNIITILTPTKAKKIISIRSFISKKFEDTGVKGRLVKFFYKNFLFKKVRYFLVPTYEIKEDLVKNYKISKDFRKVIYNPIDLKRIKILKKQDLPLKHEALFDKHRVLINVGNLTYPKGQWHLIKIFKELKKTNNNIKLVILGEGDLNGFLVNFTKKVGLKIFDYRNDDFNELYDVYLLGFQQNPYQFLYNSDIFVFSSLREGFPNSLLEAMACELPIISANCQSGPKEILDYNKYGMLLPAFDGNMSRISVDAIENIWIKKINEMLNNKSIISKYKKLSIKRVRDFELHNIIKIWEDYLRKINEP